jgi:hypothetical protein
MKEYIANLADNLIGKHNYYATYQRVRDRESLESFIDHVKLDIGNNDVLGMNPETLGRIMCAFEPKEMCEVNLRCFDFDGDCEKFLREFVSLCLAHAIHLRLKSERYNKLEIGELAKGADGEPATMTWYQFIEWGKTLSEGWRLPCISDRFEIIRAVHNTRRTDIGTQYDAYWSTFEGCGNETKSTHAELLILNCRYPDRPVYYGKNTKLMCLCVRNRNRES